MDTNPSGNMYVELTAARESAQDVVVSHLSLFFNSFGFYVCERSNE
jgi:hypothetical protein